MALTLYESNGNLIGEGTISEFDGTEAVSASGSLDGDDLNLNITSSGTIGLCDMSRELPPSEGHSFPLHRQNLHHGYVM